MKKIELEDAQRMLALENWTRANKDDDTLFRYPVDDDMIFELQIVRCNVKKDLIYLADAILYCCRMRSDVFTRAQISGQHRVMELLPEALLYALKEEKKGENTDASV